MNKWDSWQKLEQRRNIFTNIPGVTSLTMSNALPGQKNSIYSIFVEEGEKRKAAEVLFVAQDFDKTLDLTIKEGRFFSKEHATDAQNAFVVNEQFLKLHNIENPIGKGIKLPMDKSYGQIIGVVKDSHSSGLQEAIEPLVLTARTNLEVYEFLSVKVQTTNLPQTIKKEWAELEPEHPVRYSFLNENFARQYTENERFSRIMLYATGMTIFIAMLGLFGLASFMAERRTREIGVRKILGASVLGLVNLLIKDFVFLVLAAGLIAVPLSYYLVDIWLTDFAYTTPITVFPFLLAMILAVFLAVLTVSYQSIKVSMENPIHALKVE